MELTKIMALCKEPQGFHLCRNTTGSDYIFIHFLSPCDVYLKGNWTRVRKGGCVFWKCDSYQEYRCSDSALLHDYFHVHRTSPLDQIISECKLSFETVYYPADNTEITELVQQLALENLKKKAHYQTLCHLYIQKIAILLARSQNDDESTAFDMETFKRFSALRQQFQAHFKGDFSVADMASTVNLSPSRFHSLYKQIFGISPKKDFLNLRIEHAKKLMQNGNYSIREVAELAGYSNQYHFIRQFKEVTGTTPGKFIRTQKQ